MAMFDHGAERMARGPTLALPADPVGAVGDLIRRYDPAVRARGDHFAFGNGVLLYGPVAVTPKLAARAGLPAGTTIAYRASILPSAKRHGRPEGVTRQDAYRLVRGLAARTGGSAHGSRQWATIHLEASVYSARQLPPEEVIAVLQPYASGRLFVEDNPDVPGTYFLLTEESPAFFTTYWPPRLSRSTVQPPAPAIGELRGQEPCRWKLTTTHAAATAGAEVCLNVGRAALDLGRRADGVVIDSYGFPFSQPEELLPR
jgi:hypothetical protein